MEAHSPRTRLPLRARSVSTQPCQFVPVLPSVGRPEQRRILDPRINRIGIAQTRLQMPHPLELPGMLRPVIKLMRG